MRLHAIIVGSLVFMNGCSTIPNREPQSAEYLCFGFFEYPCWNAINSESKLFSELRDVIAPHDRLAQSQAPTREVVISSEWHRHAVFCSLATFPSGKGCIAEKWYLYQDAYDRWFVSRHVAEACEVWEEILITS